MDGVYKQKTHIQRLENENACLKAEIESLKSIINNFMEEEKQIDTCTAPTTEWYDDRHQADCIKINQLNVALDVMTEKYQRLRELKGL